MSFVVQTRDHYSRTKSRAKTDHRAKTNRQNHEPQNQPEKKPTPIPPLKSIPERHSKKHSRASNRNRPPLEIDPKHIPVAYVPIPAPIPVLYADFSSVLSMGAQKLTPVLPLSMVASCFMPQLAMAMVAAFLMPDRLGLVVDDSVQLGEPHILIRSMPLLLKFLDFRVLELPGCALALVFIDTGAAEDPVGVRVVGIRVRLVLPVRLDGSLLLSLRLLIVQIGLQLGGDWLLAPFRGVLFGHFAVLSTRVLRV